MEGNDNNEVNNNKKCAADGEFNQEEKEGGANQKQLTARQTRRKSKRDDQQAVSNTMATPETTRSSTSKTMKKKKRRRHVSSTASNRHTSEGPRRRCREEDYNPSEEEDYKRQCKKESERQERVWNDLVLPDRTNYSRISTATSTTGTHSSTTLAKMTEQKKRKRRISHRQRYRRHQAERNSRPRSSLLMPAAGEAVTAATAINSSSVDGPRIQIQEPEEPPGSFEEEIDLEEADFVEEPPDLQHQRTTSTAVGAFAIRGDQTILREPSTFMTHPASSRRLESSSSSATSDNHHSNQMSHSLQNDNNSSQQILVQGQLAPAPPTAEDRNQLERLFQSLRTNVPIAHAEVDGTAINEDTTIKDKCMKNQRSRRCVAMVVVVLLLVAVGVALAIVIPSSSTTPQSHAEWLPLGQELGGKEAKFYFGTSVSLSSDANVMAVGSSDQTTFNRPGHVSVFQLDHDSSSWKSLGQELVGEANGDEFGHSVDLNGDGTILAVGAFRNGHSAGHVRVFHYNMSTSRWVQRGSDIDGEEAWDRFGFSVSLSKAGDVLAAGSPGGENSSGGSCRVFQYDSDTDSWHPLGPKLFGQAEGDFFGASVSLSSSGTIVAVGARENDLGGEDAGQVGVYQYNAVSSKWDPMGSPIHGQVVYGNFGYTVSLDDSGFILAVGEPAGWSVDNDSVESRVLVFAYDSATSAWIQRGQALKSQETGNYDFGKSVSLSGNGKLLAVGSPWHDVNGLEDSGQVAVFQYNANTMKWGAVGESLNGKAVGDWFGGSVSLSENGAVVAAGARHHDFNGMKYAGSVTVYTVN